MREPEDVLRRYRTIAVVGLSSETWRPSYEVARYLQAQGYRIIPVNPNETEVLGERAYASLRDVPEPIEIVDVFRRPEFVGPVVDDAIAVGAMVVWMQDKVINEEAAAKGRAVGLTVIMDRCTARGHRAMVARGG
ncbi:MAG: CoA-binding protein [Dehalococcoidia bacterium]|nr:CoA-binding protein [Dehalococcoidia bacterium]